MSGIAISNETKYQYDIPLFLLLIAAGLTGNYFKFPLFLNIDFLFGSIFAMLALQIFGLGRGIASAALISGYTFIIWNHPYAVIIMTAEVAVVGWLIGRHKLGLVLADALYWLIVGIPLVFLFYHLVMQASLSNTNITMVKQAVNGIANALIARLIFIVFSLRFHSSRTSYKEVIYSLLAFFVLFPALIMLAVESRTDFDNTDLNIRHLLLQERQHEAQTLEAWILNRKSVIINLADMAASRSPQQLLPYLEQATKSDVNFLRIGLVDREGTSTAFFPQVDELGQSNIGRNFADRPYIPVLKQTLKPTLSEVIMGRIGTPKPIVTLLAPVVIDGKYGGYIAGVLSLDQMQSHLKTNSAFSSMRYTLLDKNGNVITTNRPDQTVMKPFVRGEGRLDFLDAEVGQWVPLLPPNTPISDRWKKSSYVSEYSIGDLAEWKLILEQPVAPFQKTLFDNYTGKLTLMFFVLLGALALAELLSRRTIATLEILSKITSGLSAKLAADHTEIAWPESNIIESDQLITNFKVMSESLAEQFSNIKQINESLEQRIEDRTSALKESEERLRLEVARMPIGYILWDKDFRVESWNPAAEEIFGFTFDEAKGKHPYELIVPPEAQPQVDEIWRRLLAGDESAYSVNENQTKDGRTIICSWTNTPLKRPDGTILGVMAMVQDVTESKHSEQLLRESEEQYRLLIAVMNEGVVLQDENSAIIAFNKSAERILGLTGDQLRGKTSFDPDWYSIHEDGSPFPGETHPVVMTLRTGEPQSDVIMGIHKPDGKLTWISINVQPIFKEGKATPDRAVATMRDITEHKLAGERIERLAHFDQLTGLPNRTLLNDHFRFALNLAQRSGESLAVMFIDLDHFKDINDTLGHSVGDQVLMEVAKRLKAALREEDTLARQGGDEYIVVLPGSDADGAALVASKLIEAVAQPCHIEQHELTVTPSIGIAIYPNDGTNMEMLSKNADTAMYRAKQEGRNDFRFYSPEMQMQSARNLQLANALRHALARDELKLHYQPQVSIQDGRIVGAEALLRWQHPELGMISPAEFIPIAEDSGQIIQIGEWVLRTAVRQLKDWIDGGMPPMMMAVNLSAVQFRQNYLPELVNRILDEVKLPHQYLELELTEAVAMNNPMAAVEVMNKLHERGIRMSIDDFGTGYSSLSYLKKFKAYKLKIDQSFIRDIPHDPEDKAIVTAIINMASSLGLQTIAEGVETASQLAFLRLQGCNEVQGYYFSKPLAAEQFEEFARKN